MPVPRKGLEAGWPLAPCRGPRWGGQGLAVQPAGLTESGQARLHQLTPSRARRKPRGALGWKLGGPGLCDWTCKLLTAESCRESKYQPLCEKRWRLAGAQRDANLLRAEAAPAQRQCDEPGAGFLPTRAPAQTPDAARFV